MVYILLGEGFEETEAIVPCDILRRGEEPTKLVALADKKVTGSHGIEIEADLLLEEISPEEMDMLVLPGGMGGVNSIKADHRAMCLIKYAYNSGKQIGAICAAPTILAELGFLEGKRAVCYPDLMDQLTGAQAVEVPVVCDGNIICSMGPGTAFQFGLSLLRARRGAAVAEAVRKGLVYQV